MSGLGRIACDTNILFPALEASHPDHRAARAWLESMVGNESFALCELVLTEEAGGLPGVRHRLADATQPLRRSQHHLRVELLARHLDLRPWLRGRLVLDHRDFGTTHGRGKIDDAVEVHCDVDHAR